MGRHFSESEVSAMGRNKIEDKGLKERLFRLHEEKTSTYDNHAKEKKRVLDLLKENRRTSGNTQVELDEKEVSEESFRNVLLSRRPWSCTPCETTFNVIYREASDPGLLKATYRLKDKGNKLSSRRASARSVPNGRRSLAVSRQSTRSEPVPQRPLSCLPGKTRTPSGNSRKFRQNDIKANLTMEGIPTKLRKPKLITAKWCTEGGTNEKTKSMAVGKVHYISNEPSSMSSCNYKLSKEEYSLQSKSGGMNEITQLSHSSITIADTNTNTVDASANITIPTIIVDVSSNTVMPTEDAPANTNIHTVNASVNMTIPTIDTSADVTVPTVDTSDNVTLPVPTVDVNSRTEVAEINKSMIRPKSKIKKRLSIQEPHLNKSTEKSNLSTKIYDLNKIGTSNGQMLGTDAVVSDSPENKTGATFNITFIDEGLQDKSTIENKKEVELIQNPVSDNNSPTVTMERQLSRPSTVALAESFEVVDFNSLQSDNQDIDYIIFKGRHIHNYVKPQLRFKHDPFAEKSRERLFRKLTTVTPVLLKEEKRFSAKSHRVYSKGARQRMLKELISENNSQSNRLSYNAENDKLESKIQGFYDSMAEFCRQNTLS